MSEMTQVAAGMAHVDRGMGVGPKPTLGVIFVAKKNQYQGEIRHMAEYYRQRLGQDPTLRLMAEEEILFGERDVVARAQRMEAEGADLIVLVVGTWIFSSIIVAAVNDLKTPFVLYGLSDRVANGNLGASLQIRYVLQEMGKRFLYLSGPVKDEGSIQTMLRYLKAAWIKRYLRNRKIATIGGKCMMMYQTQVNEFNWKSVFGVDFPQYDTVQVFHEMEQVGDEEAHRVEQEFLSRVSQVHWEWEHDREQKIYRDAIFSQAKMYLAFRRLQELYGIDVFANKCMPEMSHEAYGYGYAGCLATCMLNEAGITCACEADVPAGLSMYILRLLSGGPVFFADIARLSKERREVAFFNCGTAPISLADPAKGVHLYPIPSNISDEAVPDAYFLAHEGRVHLVRARGGSPRDYYAHRRERRHLALSCGHSNHGPARGHLEGRPGLPLAGVRPALSGGPGCLSQQQYRAPLFARLWRLRPGAALPGRDPGDQVRLQ
jgi:L-fucose isomerase-like protein